jgi:HK97 family phage prohead protease
MHTEKRMSAGTSVTLREASRGEMPVIQGYASVWNEWYVMFEDDKLVVREKVRGTAFRNALAEKQDVRALFNHDPNLLLGRTKSGTLRLIADIRGLAYSIDPPDTQTGRDVVAAIRRGDVSGSSFAFKIRTGGEVVTRRDDPETGQRIVERDIKDVDLFDVSPVTYPAYSGTDVSARSIAFPDMVKAERNRLDMDRRYARLLEGERRIGLVDGRSSVPVAMSAAKAMEARHRRLRLYGHVLPKPE